MKIVSITEIRYAGVFADEDVMSEYDIIMKLLNDNFQHNPLFTPEFASILQSNTDDPRDLGVVGQATSQNGVMRDVHLRLNPRTLADNPSWDLHTVIDMVDDPHIDNFLNEYAMNHPQYSSIMEDLGFIDEIDEQTLIHSNDDYAWSKAALYDKHIDITKYVNGILFCKGIVRCMKETRLIECLCCNSSVSFSDFINILEGAGYDEFWSNPFQINGISLTDLYIKKHTDIREILTEIFLRCDFDDIIRDEASANYSATCLLAMVSFNNWWDSTLEDEFGERVWGLIKRSWDILWDMHKTRVHYSDTPYIPYDGREKYFEILRMITRVWNPSWFVPSYDELTIAFESENITILKVVIGDTINLWDYTTYESIYKKCIMNKDLIRTKDLIEFMRNTDISLYDKCSCVDKACFRGDSAMIIGRFFYTKMIVPMRRARAVRITRNILSRVRERSGVSITKYSRCVRNIASFITS
jgi:hypothetical protein